MPVNKVCRRFWVDAPVDSKSIKEFIQRILTGTTLEQEDANAIHDLVTMCTNKIGDSNHGNEQCRYS